LMTHGWLAVGLVIFSIGTGRVGWFMHEAGHTSLTGNLTYDRLLQTVVFGLGNGLSATYWRNQHNKHHAAPQKIAT